VTGIDGAPVVPYIPLEQIEERAPGSVVQLTLERGDKPLSVSLTLAPR
jgi:hypothetical protein